MVAKLIWFKELKKKQKRAYEYTAEKEEEGDQKTVYLFYIKGVYWQGFERSVIHTTYQDNIQKQINLISAESRLTRKRI